MDKFFVYLIYLIIFLLPILSNGLRVANKGLIIIRPSGRKYTGNLTSTTESTLSKCENDKMNCENGSTNETSLNPNINRSDDNPNNNRSDDNPNNNRSDDNPNNNLIFQNDDAQLNDNIQRHSDSEINENTKQNNYTANDQFTNQNYSNDDRRNPYSYRRNRKNFNLEREEQLSDNQMLIKLNNLKMRLNSTLNKLPYRWEIYK